MDTLLEYLQCLGSADLACAPFEQSLMEIFNMFSLFVRLLSYMWSGYIIGQW